MCNDMIRKLRGAADKWESKNRIIGVGELRVCDALRDSANAIEALTAENTALHREIAWAQDCVTCAHSGVKGYPAVASFHCEHHGDVCACGHYVWRGAREAGEDNTK